MINYEIKLHLSWSKDCIIHEILRTDAVAANPAANLPALAEPATPMTRAAFQTNSTKIYISVVTLSLNNVKLLEDLKKGFKRTTSWNKYRSKITMQTQKQQFRLYD